MSTENLKKWSATPINAQLIEFLIEETKNARSPISCKRLAEEFIASTHLTNGVKAIQLRIDRIRSKVFDLEDIDWETKLKLLFVLSVPVDKESIQSSINGQFGFDKRNRINYFKSDDGKTVLKGDHSLNEKVGVQNMSRSHQKLFVEYFANRGKENRENRDEQLQELDNLVKFISEKCENISRPLGRTHLSNEFNNLNGTMRVRWTMTKRFNAYCEVIQKVGNLDTPTKVRQLFGLSANLTDECLEELRKNALVWVDDKKRIVKYSSYDGSLHLQGLHDAYSLKRFDKFVQLPTHADGNDLEEDSKEEEELSDDSDHEFDSNLQEDISNDDSNSHDSQSTSTPRTAFPKHSLKVTNSEKTSSVFNINTTRKTNYKRKFDKRSADDHKHPKKSKRAEPNAPLSDDKFRTEDYNPNPSSVHSNSLMNGGGNGEMRNGGNHEDENQAVRESKVNNDDQNIQGVPRRVDAPESDYEIKKSKVSINPKPRIRVKQEPAALVDVKPSAIPVSQTEVKQEPISPAPAIREVKQEPAAPVPFNAETETPKLRLCRALKSLASALNNKKLSSFSRGLEKRIKRYERSVEYTKNNIVTLVLQTCITDVSNESVEDLPESPETVNLLKFLCYVKVMIVKFTLRGVEGVLEKIKELGRESQNKSVSVLKVSEALQETLRRLC